MDERRSSGLLLMEATLHRSIAHAHEEYARGLSAVAGDFEDASVPELRGRGQKSLVGVAEVDSEAGMSAGEISRRLDYDESNSYSVLKSLTESGVLEEV